MSEYYIITKEDIEVAKRLFKRFPDFKPDLWYCLGIDLDNKTWKESPHPGGAIENEWMVLSDEMNGYKWAKKRVPFFETEDLMELLGMKPVNRNRDSLIEEALS